MDHAVLQPLNPVSGMICLWPCVHHPAHSDSFKDTEDNTVLFRHDLVLSWLCRPSKQRDVNSLTYLLTYGLTTVCALFVYSIKSVFLTLTAVVTKSVLTIVSATRPWSAATAVQTASVDERLTTIHSVRASRRAGRSRRVPVTETAATATSARCTTTSATRSVSTTCRSEAVCVTGNARGQPDAGCGHPLLRGLPARDGGPCSLGRVVCRGRRTSPGLRRRQRRPTRYQISRTCKNCAVGDSAQQNSTENCY